MDQICKCNYMLMVKIIKFYSNNKCKNKQNAHKIAKTMIIYIFFFCGMNDRPTD